MTGNIFRRVKLVKIGNNFLSGREYTHCFSVTIWNSKCNYQSALHYGNVALYTDGENENSPQKIPLPLAW